MAPGRAKRSMLALAAFCAACSVVPAGTTPTSTAESRPTSVPRATAATPTALEQPATPSATLGPGPRTFNEEFQGSLGYWQFRQVDNGQPADPPQAINGILLFSLPAPNQWALELYAPQEYTEVRVDAKVEFSAGAQGAAGVICRYDENRGWYEFNIYPDQTYVLLFGKWLGDGVASYTPLAEAQSDKIQATDNEIGLLCQGTVLTPFVNGTQLRRRSETTFGLTSGKVGVTAASFENSPGSIGFDWVRVGEP